jgi:AmmeMemoRadiSam system protein B
MPSQPVRRPAVAGSWYPGDAAVLAREVDRYLSAVPDEVEAAFVHAVVSPHAGLIYSGPVAAWAYRAVQGRPFDVAVLVGPSHQVGFEGVAIYPRGSFDTPLGPIEIAEAEAAAILASTPAVRDYPAAHAREHSLEMQLPFLKRVLPDVPIVPLVMGYQSPDIVEALALTLSRVLRGRRVLLIASSDLSHYLDARSAAAMDAVVLEAVNAFNADALLRALESEPQHACGGGPIVTVMKAAHSMGARQGRVLKYGTSGDVSGDHSAVVGYMAAAFGEFPDRCQ